MFWHLGPGSSVRVGGDHTARSLLISLTGMERVFITTFRIKYKYKYIYIYKKIYWITRYLLPEEVMQKCTITHDSDPGQHPQTKLLQSLLWAAVKEVKLPLHLKTLPCVYSWTFLPPTFTDNFIRLCDFRFMHRGKKVSSHLIKVEVVVRVHDSRCVTSAVCDTVNLLCVKAQELTGNSLESQWLAGQASFRGSGNLLSNTSVPESGHTLTLSACALSHLAPVFALSSHSKLSVCSG
ncbi:hypothetical protein EK904_000531 [Melospiza melodia maxima]|nr:hypothetical protein EK904_000531 [Melospiza melodia maxima]